MDADANSAAPPPSNRSICIAIDLGDKSGTLIQWAVNNYIRPGDSIVLLHIESERKLDKAFDDRTALQAQDLGQPLEAAEIPYRIHVATDDNLKDRLSFEVNRLNPNIVVMGVRVTDMADMKLPESFRSLLDSNIPVALVPY